MNDFIDPKLCYVKYASFDEAVAIVQVLGKGCLLGKSDVKIAFRIIPVPKMSLTSLGFVSTTGTLLTKPFLMAVQLVVLHLNDLLLSLNLQCLDDPQWGGCYIIYMISFLVGKGNKSL